MLAAVAVAAFVVTTWLLAIASHAKPGTDRANARLDAVRTGLAAGAGAGPAVGLISSSAGSWWRGHDRTEHGGAHRLMSSRTTRRQKSEPVSGIGMPKLWAYTSSRGTAVASTS